MKQRWLNLILHLTSKIHNKKQKLVMSTLGKAMKIALQIVLLELFLLIISFPTYFFIEEGFTLTKEHKETEVVNYKIRRKFVVSLIIIVGFILLILFAIKATISVFFAPINVM